MDLETTKLDNIIKYARLYKKLFQQIEAYKTYACYQYPTEKLIKLRDDTYIKLREAMTNFLLISTSCGD